MSSNPFKPEKPKKPKPSAPNNKSTPKYVTPDIKAAGGMKERLAKMKSATTLKPKRHKTPKA